MCTPVVYSKCLLCDIDLVNLRCNQEKKKKWEQWISIAQTSRSVILFLDTSLMWEAFRGRRLQSDVITLHDCKVPSVCHRFAQEKRSFLFFLGQIMIKKCEEPVEYSSVL